jgi:hypothetical protein
MRDVADGGGAVAAFEEDYRGMGIGVVEALVLVAIVVLVVWLVVRWRKGSGRG